jgi:hypothetical protein
LKVLNQPTAQCLPSLGFPEPSSPDLNLSLLQRCIAGWQAACLLFI